MSGSKQLLNCAGNLLRVVLICFFLYPFCRTIAQAPAQAVPIIALRGEAFERGFQHGSQLKKEIAAVFAKWKANIRKTTNGDADSLLRAFRSVTNFERATKTFTPAILEEIKGIAAGSGQPYDDVYAFQLVDEFWIYLDKQSHSGNHHCSGIGVPGTAGKPAYIAQNMDLENYMHGFQVLLHLAATSSEPEQYVLSCAGLVALGGMNDKGIALCMNTLMELKASDDGLPVAFIIRGVLAKRNGPEALQFLKSVKHASGQNYILGIQDSVYNFEASCNEVVRYLPGGEQNGVVYHTNHALVNHDVKDWYRPYHENVLAGKTKSRNSEIRFASLEQHLNKPAASISPAVIKTTLRSKDNEYNPVCREYKEGPGGFTFSSVIYTLGGRRSIQLTYGPPDQSDYSEYFFDGSH